MDWKEKYKTAIKDKLKESDEQYKLYKTTKKVKYLNKAGNALFIAVKKHMMIKYNQRIPEKYYNSRNVTGVFREILKMSDDDRHLLMCADYSRIKNIYYGWEPGPVTNDDYKSARKEMKAIMKKKARIMTLGEARPYMKEAMKDNKEFLEKLSKM